MLEERKEEVYQTYKDGRTWVQRHPNLTVLYSLAAIALVGLLAYVAGRIV